VFFSFWGWFNFCYPSLAVFFLSFCFLGAGCFVLGRGIILCYVFVVLFFSADQMFFWGLSVFFSGNLFLGMFVDVVLFAWFYYRTL